MGTIELSGEIAFSYSDQYPQIYLIQNYGYRINLVWRFKEFLESFPNTPIQVNYYVSDTPCTLKEVKEEYLTELIGGADIRHRYTQWSCDVGYATTLTVGGHDLFNELSDKAGKYLNMTISIVNRNPDHILIAEVKKKYKHGIDSEFGYRTTFTSFDKVKLKLEIEKHLGQELVKNDTDDFPYFTDGGFKYRGETEDYFFDVEAHQHRIV